MVKRIAFVFLDSNLYFLLLSGTILVKLLSRSVLQLLPL